MKAVWIIFLSSSLGAMDNRNPIEKLIVWDTRTELRAPIGLQVLHALETDPTFTLENAQKKMKLIGEFVEKRGKRICSSSALFPVNAVLQEVNSEEKELNTALQWLATDQGKKYVELLKSRASKGNPDAFYRLGTLFWWHQQEQMDCYKAAAALGHADAAVRCGIHEYENKNYRSAINYFTSAHNLGNALGSYAALHMYGTGDGIAQDEVRAQACRESYNDPDLVCLIRSPYAATTKRKVKNVTHTT